MTDDKLTLLRKIEVPPPSAEARQRAIDAAMLAYDRAREQKTSKPAQGTNWGERLRSIVQPKRGNWIMDTRIGLGLGTAAIALLLLPLGYQLYTSTSMTPPVIGVPPVTRDQVPPVPQTRPEAVSDERLQLQVNEQKQKEDAATVATTPTTTTAGKPADGNVSQLASTDQQQPMEIGDLANREVRTVAVNPDGTINMPLPEPEATVAMEPLVTTEEGADRGRLDTDDMEIADMPLPIDAMAPPPSSPKTVASPTGQPLLLGGSYRGGEAAPQVAAEALQPGLAAQSAPSQDMTVMPSPMPQGPTATEPSGDQFTQFVESPVKIVAEEPVSTFSIDVDTASYSYVRSALEEGWMPEPDAVRIEEMINYFSYNYAGPELAETPFKPTVAVFPAPWNPSKQLVQIGIKGYEPPADADPASNLTFLIDTSGSMDGADRIELVKRSFKLLVDQLTANDTVSIVVYAGSAGVVLEPTKGTDKAKILAAIDNLYAGGSTAGAEGIELAYRLAEQGKIANGINRVILATDGDFNVGISDPDDLVDFVKEKRESGIFLSVLGYGMGNYQDDTMQSLAQNGNGNAAYIDSFREAQKVLVEEMGSTLETIAKDVKIQIEFNPAFVKEYRLIGYETRALNREDFNNDKVDAGDIGAGHTVTALYEITPAGAPGLVDPLRYGGETPAVTEPSVAAPMGSDELGFLKLRYKLPTEDVSKLIEIPITRSLSVDSVNSASEDQRWAAAVAAFAQKLKGSNYGDMSWDAIRQLAQTARGSDESGYRAEFMQLIDAAKVLDPNG